MAPNSGLHVIVVGAGPAGLLLSLMLAKKGVKVEVVEAADRVDSQARATHYGPPAVAELRRAGVIDDIRERGFILKTVCWRKLDGTYLAGLNNDVLGDYEDKVTCLPLDKVSGVIYEHLKKQPTAEVKWQHKVTDIGQNDKTAWVDVETPEGQKRLEADYIVGCDGANSQIRRSLFGAKNFPGHTWDEQIVATNTYYDFDRFGWDDSNFIIDREHWYMAARISQETGAKGLWRVTYGEKPGLTREELLARQPKKFEEMLPGNPKPHEYKLANISPYKVHQRCAERLRLGRFLLAADAAHLCNPFGGLGLTGGIIDVGGLYDCLIGIHEGKADPSILDRYDEVRRQKYQEIVNPISSDNLRRMYQDPEKALEDDSFLQECLKCAADPVYSREFQLGVNGLSYDFTQHYKPTIGNVGAATAVL